MSHPLAKIYSDTAQVQHATICAFCSGRLIGKNLVLTARHPLVKPDGEPIDKGWRIRLLRDRALAHGAANWEWHEAQVVWRGQAGLDIALLAIVRNDCTANFLPELSVRAATVQEAESHPALGLGFPRGMRENDKRVLLAPSGVVVDEHHQSLAFAVDQAFQPEVPDQDWRGFSGGAIVDPGTENANFIWLYGVAETVPANFKRRLSVSRIAEAFTDTEFRRLLESSEVAIEEPTDPIVPLWNDLVLACRKLNELEISSLSKSRRYNRALSVRRSSVEDSFRRFLTTEKPLFVLSGQTGTGKTFFLADLIEQGNDLPPSLLFLAYKLTPSGEGIQEAITKVLTRRFPRVVTSNNAFRLDNWSGRLGQFLVAVDGLNELPGNPQSAAAWLEKSLNWIKLNDARMILTARPEYWELVARFIDPADVYTEEAPASEYDEKTPMVVLDDFTEAEAELAGRLYGLLVTSSSSPAFRHPLLLRVMKETRSPGVLKSVYETFHSYFETNFDRIRSRLNAAVPNTFFWAVIAKIANRMRSNSTLWIKSDTYFELFGHAFDLANAAIDEHLFLQGSEGLRFAFDELAYCLVAGSADVELDGLLAVDPDLSVCDRDPLLWESIPLVLSKLESANRQDAVKAILSTIARSRHHEFHRASILVHRILIRSVQWLIDASIYAPELLAFAANCSAHTEFRLERFHTLLPLCEIDNLTPDQRYGLLRVIALAERDGGWRWKDWEDIAPEEFWQPVIKSDFLNFAKRELEIRPEGFIAALLTWVSDETRLKADDNQPEASLSDLASAILHFTHSSRFREIAEALADRAEQPNHTKLLRALASNRPVETIALIEEWDRLGMHAMDRITAEVAREILSNNLPEHQLEQVSQILKGIVSRVQDSDLKALALAAMIRIPSSCDIAMSEIQHLSEDPDATLDPGMFRNLDHLDQRRVMAVLANISVRNASRERREFALWILGSIRIVEEPMAVFLYLLSFPSSRVDGYNLGLAFEWAFGNLKRSTLPNSQLALLFKRAWRKLPPHGRYPLLHPVTNIRVGERVDYSILRFAVQKESDERNLQMLLRKIARANLAFAESLALIEVVSRKQRRFPVGIAILVAAWEDREFAMKLASSDREWGGELHPVAEFAQQIADGVDIDDAFLNVFDSHRSEWD
jgi:hypothetical protein